MIQFSKPTLGVEEQKAVERVLKSGWLAAGPETEAFENEFAKYVGVKYAIFTNSCTSALKIAYKYVATGMENGYLRSRFAIPKNTFCATYSAVYETICGDVVWQEECEDEMDYDYRVNVHYGGRKDETKSFIEDSAHRIMPNDPLIGKIRCYSFYATKNMTTGSGGMFVTNDKDIYDFARLCWKDGIDKSTAERYKNGNWHYDVKIAAGGYDGNDIAAAIGREQLKKLDSFNERRQEIVDEYNKAFGRDWTGNHLYPLEVGSVENVDKFMAFMKDKGIACGYHYPNTRWTKVSLPLYPLLTTDETKYIIKSARDFLNQ